MPLHLYANTATSIVDMEYTQVIAIIPAMTAKNTRNHEHLGISPL